MNRICFSNKIGRIGEAAHQNPSHILINRLIDIRIALYTVQGRIELQYELYTQARKLIFIPPCCFVRFLRCLWLYD